MGSAVDIDNDGHDDLVVGEPLWNPTGLYEGRIQVLSGADGSVLLSITGPYTETSLGRYVAGVNDWNGDGTNDIAASGWDIADLDSDGVGDDAIGIVYVFSGADGSILAELPIRPAPNFSVIRSLVSETLPLMAWQTSLL